MDEKKSAMLNAIGSEIGMTRDTVEQDGDSLLIDYLTDNEMIDRIRIEASDTFDELSGVDVLYSKAFMERYDGSVEPRWNAIDPKELYDRTDILDRIVSDLKLLQVNDRFVMAGNDGSIRLFINDEEVRVFFENMLTRKMQDISNLTGVRDAANALIGLRENGLTEELFAGCGYQETVLPAGKDVMVLEMEAGRKMEFESNPEEIKGFAYDSAMRDLDDAVTRAGSAISFDEGRRLLRNVKKVMTSLDSILDDEPGAYFASKGWSFYEGRRTNPLRLEDVFQFEDEEKKKGSVIEELPSHGERDPQQEEQGSVREQGDAHEAEHREEKGQEPHVEMSMNDAGKESEQAPVQEASEEEQERTEEKEEKTAEPAHEEEKQAESPEEEKAETPAEKEPVAAGPSKIAGRSSKEASREFQ